MYNNTKSETSTLIKVVPVSFRHIVSPYDALGTKTYMAVLNVTNVPEAIEQWRNINVRDANVNSGVAKKIKSTLEDSPESFFFKNRGMTLLVKSANFNNKDNILEIEMSDATLHGLLDGGHTYKVIRNFIDNLEDKTDEVPAYVKIEILEGINDRDQVVNIVESRNTSTQVKQQGLDELRGIYDDIKKVLADKPYSERIAYKEYELLEDGTRKDIDIRDILSYIMCFDIETFNDKKHPIVSYTSKSAVVDHFGSNHERMVKYVKLLPAILELHDTIYFTLRDAYNSTGGKFGRLTGIAELKRTHEKLPFINESSPLSIPSGFIYPILASFRNLVNISDSQCSWKTNPLNFYEDMKCELARRVGDQALTFRNPNKLGKDSNTWQSCYDAVKMEVLIRQI